MSHDPNARARAEFWSGAGFLLGAWSLISFFFFLLLLLLLPEPKKPEPGPLTRAELLQSLSTLLHEQNSDRYAALAALSAQLQSDPRLTDDHLRAELKESFDFARALATPRPYLMTPRWVEVPAESLPSGPLLPFLRIEAINDAVSVGTAQTIPAASLPSSQPESQGTFRRLSFGEISPLRVWWRAGEPLRLRISVQGAWLGASFSRALGGDDLERAQDAPLPDASALLLGETRAFSRGEGRYLAFLVPEESQEPLSVPLLLLDAVATPPKE